MYSRWPIREDTDALIATDGPGDTRDPAFVIRRVPSGTSAGTDVIMFGAGCTDRVRAFVDHVPARGGRWRNVTGPDAKYTECTPPVDELEASFVGYVNGTSRLATAPRAAFPRIATNRITAEVHRRLLGSSRRRWLRAIVVQIDDGSATLAGHLAAVLAVAAEAAALYSIPARSVLWAGSEPTKAGRPMRLPA